MESDTKNVWTIKYKSRHSMEVQEKVFTDMTEAYRFFKNQTENASIERCVIYKNKEIISTYNKK